MIDRPQRRATEARTAGIRRVRQMTITELIDALTLCDSHAEVKFAFGLHPLIEPGQPPLSLYQPLPDTVALKYTDQGQPPTATQLVDAISPWVNQYLPTDFGVLRIDPDMPLWAGPESGDTAIVAVCEEPEYDLVFIETWATA